MQQASKRRILSHLCHRGIDILKAGIESNAFADQLIVAKHGQNVGKLFIPSARLHIVGQPHAQSDESAAEVGLDHTHQRIAALQIIDIRFGERRQRMHMH